MEMRNSIREQAINYIKRFTLNENWVRFVRSWVNSYTYAKEHYGEYYTFDELFEDMHGEYDDMYYCNGAEKNTVIIDDFDWVIKFMRDGIDPDSCEVEAYNYAVAAQEGLASFFAPTYYLTKIDGICFYIQQKCEPDEYGFEDKIADVCRQNYCDEQGITYTGESVSCDKWNDYGDSDTTNEFLCDWWGTDAFDRFEKFCEQHDINDIHCGNIAYYRDDIVVIDFSGYHGGSGVWFDKWKDSSDKAVNIKF